MARRTVEQLRQDIEDLLPTNGIGAITAEDIRTTLHNIVDTMSPGYCAQLNSLDISVPIDDLAPTLLDIFDAELLPRDQMFSYLDGVVTITHAGVVRVTAGATFEGPSNQEFKFDVSKNGATYGYSTRIDARGVDKPSEFSIPNAIIDVAPSDTISVLAIAEGGSHSVLFTEGEFIVEYVMTIGTGIV